MTKTEIEKQIMAALSEKSYQPLKQKRLIRFLELEPDEDETAIEIISELLQKGSIVHLQKKGLALAQSVDLIAGTITFLRSGAAFVRTQDDQEYFIPGGNTGTAMPGDSVLISLSKRSSRRPRSGGDSPEGMVMSVSKRHSLTIVATIYKQNNSYFAEPFQSKISKHPEIDDIAGAKAGERVLVKLEDWDNPKMNPKGAIIEIIGPADNPALDTISVIKSHSLPEGFPPEVVEEAQAMTISESDLEERLDLRDNFIFTIDPETARDFDDAISLEEVDGKWKLGVHIADVSHYVAPGTELDKEAVKRATSVYLPDKVIPMLPEQLSNGLCSLSPGNDRLAFSIFLSLDNEGNVLGATFSKTVIHSKLRLSYEQAQLALESQKNSSFPQYDMDQKTVDLIKQVNHLAVKIRARRFKVDMSLNLNIPEVRFRINNEGRIETMLQEGSSESHQLIEECMLLANEYVCRELMDHK
ncbi:MAG: RNB domain-containing ribonuclease, partial [Lentisphaeria bacterium]|nr:ribonuclease R [Lentisphaeria bacterium]NQZ67011.1 RNB domain-containing ribonuclease [Lentisphaeria bacterium]